MATQATRTSASLGAPAREVRLLADGLRRWARSLTRPSSDAPAVVVLEGEPGHGKHLLVRTLEPLCANLGISVLGGRFFRRRVPGGPFADVLESVGESSVSSSAAATAEKVTSTSEGEIERLQFVDGCVSALLEHVREAPTALVLEEIQRCDSLSRGILLHLLRMMRWERKQLGGRRLLLVLTATPGGAGEIEEILNDRRYRIPVLRVEARGYSRDDLQDLARQRFGTELPLSLREHIHRKAQGNTRLLSWLLSAYQRTRRTRTPVPGEFETLESLVSARFREITSAEQDAVLVLAILGSGADLDAGSPVVQVLAERHCEGLGAEGWPLLFEGLKEEGWVEDCSPAPLSGVRLRYVDFELAPIALGSVDPHRVLALRRRLASEFLLGERPSGAQLVLGGGALVEALELAWSLEGRSRRGERCRVVSAEPLEVTQSDVALLHDLTGRACEVMEDAGCYQEALDFSEEVAELFGSIESVDAAVRRGARERVLRYLELTGNHREAAELLESLGPASEQPRVLFEHWRRLGDVKMPREDKREARRCFEIALERGGDSISSVERRAVTTRFVELRLQEDDVSEAMRLIGEGLEQMEREKSSPRPGDIEFLEAATDVLVRCRDHARAARCLAVLLAAQEGCGQLGSMVRTLERLASVHLLLGDDESAEDALRQCGALAEASHCRLLEAKALRSLGGFLADQQLFLEAVRCLEEARRIFDDFGHDGEARKAELGLPGLQLRLGRYRSAARTVIDLVERTLGARGGWPIRPVPLRAVGDADVRRAGDAPGGDGTRRGELRERGDVSLADLLRLGRTWLREGRLREARKLLQEALEAGPSPASPGDRATLLRLTAHVAHQQGDVSSALAAYERSLQCLSASPNEEELAKTYVAVSGVLLDTGSFDRALDYVSRGARRLLALDSPRGALRALTGIADLLFEAGQGHAGGMLASSAVALADANALGDWQLRGCRLVARALSEAGLTSRAEVAFRRAWDLDKVLHLPVESCWLRLEAAWDRLRVGEHGEALRLAREGIERSRALDVQLLIDEFLYVVGVIDSMPTNPAKNFLRAFEALETALEGAQRHGGRPRLRYQVLLAMRAVYAARGKETVARELEERAAAIREAVRRDAPRGLAGLSWRPRHALPATETVPARASRGALECG